jgi:hypothetical protein
MNQITFGQLRARTASEILLLSDKAKQRPELLEFAKAYSSVLDVYNLAALIWQCEGGIEVPGCENPTWANIRVKVNSLGIDSSSGPPPREVLRDVLKIARKRQEKIEDVYLALKR